jgi:hypothetical protein
MIPTLPGPKARPVVGNDGIAEETGDGVAPGTPHGEASRHTDGEDPGATPRADLAIVPYEPAAEGAEAGEVIMLETGIAENPDPNGRDLKAIAESRDHKLLHGEKNPWCQICRTFKMQHVPARRRTNVVKPKKFGQKITLDHVYARSEQMEGLDGNRDLLVIYDLATSWIHLEPVKNKTAALTIEGLNKFKGPDGKIASVYSDNSNEIQSIQTIATRLPKRYEKCAERDRCHTTRRYPGCLRQTPSRKTR